jgi:two-component system KDP operon response regulator KdpE
VSTDQLVLVIEDEPQIRRFLRATLTNHGYRLIEAVNAQEGLAHAATHNPALIILDLGLPDLDGLDVTRQVREWSDVPILVLSARGQEQDKIAALDAGADDYLTKPFGVSELSARIRVALRRSKQPDEVESVFQDQELLVDFVKREVRVRDLPVTLTPTEYSILRTLVIHAGKVLTHQQLIKEVWGGNYEVNSHLLRVNISNLRRKIENDPIQPRHIITEPGVGYRFKEIEKKI